MRDVKANIGLASDFNAVFFERSCDAVKVGPGLFQGAAEFREKLKRAGKSGFRLFGQRRIFNAVD